MEQEIIEGNKLIAEFDKLKTARNGAYLHGSNFYNEKELLYHTSWDWLMPIVEKIEGLGFTVDIKDTACWIDKYGENHIIAGSRIKGTKITAVWLAVIDFINYYNETIKTKP